MDGEAGFFERWAEFFPDGVWEDDDQSTDVMALVVLDEVPTKTLDEILRSNKADCGGASYLWLADSYDSLPHYAGGAAATGTEAPVGAGWRSPFAGGTVEDAAAFVRAAPKPPKPLCRVFFAALRRDLYERRGQLLVCRVDEAGGGGGGVQVQEIPCAASQVGGFFAGFERGEWEESLRRWREEGIGL